VQADDLPKPTKWADHLTADHEIINDDESRKGDRIALIIQDKFTSWLQGYSSPTKSANDTIHGFQRFLGPQLKPQYVYTDGSKEFKKAFQELNFLADTSTPHRSETNGVAERAVRRLKEGTSCTLFQSGFYGEWWPEAMDAYCFLRNATDVLNNNHTAYFNRFGEDFRGPVIPFGSHVEYHPITEKDKDRLHKYGGKVLPGIFMGCHQKAGVRGAATSTLRTGER